MQLLLALARDEVGLAGERQDPKALSSLRRLRDEEASQFHQHAEIKQMTEFENILSRINAAHEAFIAGETITDALLFPDIKVVLMMLIETLSKYNHQIEEDLERFDAMSTEISNLRFRISVLESSLNIMTNARNESV